METEMLQPLQHKVLPLFFLGWISTVFASVGVATVFASPPAAARSQEDPGMSGNRELLGALVNNLDFSAPLPSRLLSLLAPHEQQLERIFKQNPELITEGLVLVIAALPALQSMSEDNRTMELDKGTYAKAQSLLDKCEFLATPDLARDLERARTLMDKHIRQVGETTLIVDLGE
jgi:hypothetical protein